MSESVVDIRLKLVASLFVFFGGLSCLTLFFVFLVHLKYNKFRRNIFSIIFGCVICEYMFSLHFLWTGFSSLVIGVDDIGNFVCGLNANLLNFFINTLFFYHIITILLILFGKMPIKSKLNKNKFKNIEEKKVKNKIFFFIHVLSISLSLVHTLIFSLTKSYGRGLFGSCYVKKEENHGASLLLGIPFLTYCALGILYLIMNCRKNYSTNYPTLKNLPLYYIFTSTCWAVMFVGYPFILGDTYNSIAISCDLLALIVVAYFRVTNSYIKIVLKHGDSNNQFVQAILIFFCLDTKVDLKNLEKRETLTKLTSDFQIN